MRSGAIHDVISAIIYCLINAVDGCGDHATTKPVDVSLCMGARGQCKMEYSVPEFILYIHCICVSVPRSRSTCDVCKFICPTKLRTICLSREMDTVIIIVRISAYVSLN